MNCRTFSTKILASEENATTSTSTIMALYPAFLFTSVGLNICHAIIVGSSFLYEVELS